MVIVLFSLCGMMSRNGQYGAKVELERRKYENRSLSGLRVDDTAEAISSRSSYHPPCLPRDGEVGQPRGTFVARMLLLFS